MSGAFAVVGVLVGVPVVVAGAAAYGVGWLTLQVARLTFKGVAKAAGFCGRVAVEHALPAARAGLSRIRSQAEARREAARDRPVAVDMRRRMVQPAPPLPTAAPGLGQSSSAAAPRAVTVRPVTDRQDVGRSIGSPAATRVERTSPVEPFVPETAEVVTSAPAVEPASQPVTIVWNRESPADGAVLVLPAEAGAAVREALQFDGSLAAVRDSLVEAAEEVALAETLDLDEAPDLAVTLDRLAASLELGEDPLVVLVGARDVLAEAKAAVEAFETEEQAAVLRRIGHRKEVRLLMETLRALSYTHIRIAERDGRAGWTVVKAVPPGGRQDVTAVINADGSALFDTRGAFRGRACVRSLEAVRKDFVSRLGIDLRIDELTHDPGAGGQTTAGCTHELAARRRASEQATAPSRAGVQEVF